jgi:tripartite ATP-independent transporter DctM subunit
MNIETITILLFASLFILLLSGLPVTFAVGSVAIVFAAFLWGPESLYMIGSNVFGMMIKLVLVALPGFVFMANMLERSGVAEDLYTMMYRWAGPLRGGLAVGTVFICTVFAAMSGVSAAGTVTMGVIALPSMLKRKYQKTIAIGCIMAGGALGQLIPPSLIMIIYGMMASVSVARLFAGGVFPGLVLAGLFIAYIIIRSYFQPQVAPALDKDERATWHEKLFSLKAIVLPIFLVMLVLGSIFMGVTSPTEAAAFGAAGAVICAAINRRLTWTLFKDACYRTGRLCGMVMWIIFAAAMFAALYNAVNAYELIEKLLLAIPGGALGSLIAIQITLLFLGCFLDPTAIIMVTVPIFIHVVIKLGYDPVWFGVLFVTNMEMAFLTPPFGSNIFYMKGVAPPEISVTDIYRSLWPFVLLQLTGLIIVIAFPAIVLWLPGLLFD